MSAQRLILRYAAFALIAMLVNLGAQRAVLALHAPGAGFAAALVTGTALGLVVKYVLDKRWIFFDRATGLGAHGRRFSLYTGMGLVTTLLFWGTETAFWTIGRTEALRETGAVLGLVAGYALKYALDRRYVFTGARPAGAGGAGGAA